MDVRIEPIALKHIEGSHRAVDFISRERKYLAFLEAPPLEQARQFVMKNIEQNYPQYVAIADNRVVGRCDVIPKSRPVYSHAGVLGIGLLPEWRGKGNGRALMAITLDGARRYGLCRVELTVHADNARAIALYEKLGFYREGLLRKAVLIDGIYLDSALMALVWS